MTNIEKIRQEIERRMKMILGVEGLVTGVADNMRYQGYKSLLAFIDSLPEEKPSEDLEKEIQGMYQAIFGTDIINRREMVYLVTFDMIARHFAEWGAKHKDSLHISETCKENADSFNELPRYYGD